MVRPSSGSPAAEAIVGAVAREQQERVEGGPKGGGTAADRADNDKLNFPFSTMTQQLVGTALATLLSSGSVSNAAGHAIANPLGLGSMLLGQALSRVVAGLTSGWQLDDESGAAEYAAKAAVDKILAELQSQLVGTIMDQIVPSKPSPGLVDQVQEFFADVQSDAKLEAAAIGAPDDKGNAVGTSAVPSVLIQGVPSTAAMADLVVPAGKAISDGSTTVRLGDAEFMLARESSKTMAPSVLQKAAAIVLVGGAAPPALATKAAEEALAGGATAAQATSKSDGVTTAANRAREKAKADGKSDAEAEAYANKKAEEKAAEKPVALRVAEGLNNAGYRDGGKGLSEGFVREPIKQGDVMYVDPATGKHYTESELDGMESLGMNPEAGVCEPGMAELARSIRQNGECWTVEMLRDGDPSGYRAVLFRRQGDNQRVLDFNGTSSTSVLTDPDWRNNFAQGLGLNPLAPQYAAALADAEAIWELDAGLMITGHSLGGGLASYAAAYIGANAVLFNPAGLGTTSMAVLNAEGQPIRPGQFTTYVVDGEVLTGVGTMVVQQPHFFGDVTVLPRPEGMGRIEAHQMQAIGQILNTTIPGTAYVPNQEYLGFVPPNLPPRY
jgi:hypothetical protein